MELFGGRLAAFPPKPMANVGNKPAKASCSEGAEIRDTHRGRIGRDLRCGVTLEVRRPWLIPRQSALKRAMPTEDVGSGAYMGHDWILWSSIFLFSHSFYILLLPISVNVSPFPPTFLQPSFSSLILCT